jgi:ATP-dependent DNA helicase RecG
MDLGSSVQFVKGIGPRKAGELEATGIRTVEDLLLHLPMRYEDRTQLVRIADLRAGMKVAVTGTITVAGLRRARRMTIYEVRLDDDSGRLKALWFNQPFLKESLVRGARVTLFGDIVPDSYGGRQLMMSSPQHEVLDDEAAAVHTGRVVPVYEKLGPLTGNMLRRILTTLAPVAAREAVDALPEDVRTVLGVISRGDALRRVHVPDEADAVEALNAFRSAGHRRLILEELFLFEVGLALKHERRRERPKRAAFTVTDAARDAVKRILPFRLTEAQRRVLREIAADLQCPHPMNRLVQGDVGSGKTVVALLAMVVVLENGAQAAFMAPTEILAEQHFLTLRRLLARCAYKVEVFTSALKGKERAQAAERLASGETRIAVGTHALIQEGVTFHRLGLAVVDEQHRFGVLQRDELRRKGLDVDVLVMTATPIPRTLALTAYGDLDVSLLDERPPGRTPIATRHRPASDRRAIVDTVRAAVAGGRQAYVVYPLVEESEKLEDIKAATSMAAEWAAALPEVRVGLLHGRMKSAEKDAVMASFHRTEIDVLVSTTVIEVGVDVPNATLMVIEHAERFGLSQLHQLRGRVGRGTAASACLLVTHGHLSAEARARIDVMVRTEDGFEIAEKDLELRGPGDFFGTRQSGLPLLRVADLMRDRDLLEEARAAAFALVRRGPAGTDPLRALLGEEAWERRFGLARVG